MSPFSLFYTGNELLLNRRCKILELGTGISTIYLARLIRQMKVKAEILTVDHLASFQNNWKEVIAVESLSNIIQLVYAPLQSNKSDSWYDKVALKQALENFGSIDMLLIDGPPAHNETLEHSRYPAMSFFLPYLAQEHVIFLHDADRKGELETLACWEKEFAQEFFVCEDIATCYKGKYQSAIPNLITKNINYSAHGQTA